MPTTGEPVRGKMRNFQKFRLVFAIVAVSGMANAAELIIDNQSIPGSDIESISISPTSGNIFITTTPGYTITKDVVGDGASIDSFAITPNTILAGGSATLSWTTTNATSCTASNGVGGWGGAVAVDGSQQITTSLLGVHTFTLTCTGDVGDPAVSSRTLTVESANAVVINTFIASPNSITEGDTTTISWSVDNADSCTASNGTGGWAGSVISLPTGSKQVTVATPGSYTFTLNCQNAGGGSDTATTSVTASPVGVQCVSSPLSADIRDWNAFWSQDFPRPVYANKDVSLSRTGYLALRFNTGNVVDHGAIATIETTTTDGIRLGSISQCPGDFDVPAECRKVWGIGGSVQWATDGYARACQLQPNTDYYFNVTFTDGTDPATTSCSRYPCVTTIQVANF